MPGILLATAVVAGCESSPSAPKSAGTLAIVSGDSQSATAGTALAESLTVQALGPGGGPQAGVVIRWSASGGAVASPATSTSGANGLARTAITLGIGTGAITITASAANRAAVGFSATSVPVVGNITLALQDVAMGLTAPLYVTAPSGDPRLFIVEQPGRIRIVKNGTLLPTPFLDLTDKVSYGGEQGLLSVAFDPQYAQNGWFYVDYTNTSGDTRVERYTVSSGDPDVADTASHLTILGVAQPYDNHNGGLLLFGPDSMLYIGLGDGGSGGDPQNRAQNLDSLLGKILRVDVRGASGAQPYSIPANNPFVGIGTHRGEIWAYGLRNPWRYSFDRATGRLYIGDVGQDVEEEVDIEPAGAAGLNYGWNVTEGRRCYQGAGCDSTGFSMPRLVYDHGSTNCAITGGFVYRGSAIPEMVGRYFYSDYCAGWLRTFYFDGTTVSEQQDWNITSVGSITSFGEDAAGELYMTSANGHVYRVVKQ
jgi:glucose/arabinose dehydrogenase